MKLARYTIGSRPLIGVVVADRIIELAAVLPRAPGSIREVLAGGPELLQKIADRLPQAGAGVPLCEVRLEAPVPDAQKYLAIGMNYHDHAEEARRLGVPTPKTQLWFNKQITCITGPFDEVQKPKVTDRMDYEAELGVVIGRQCRHVPESDALSVVGGYFVANDLTARDWQAASPTFTLGKSFDTHGPIGPWIVTADEIPDPQSLQMRLFVNGELRQKQSTAQMIYSVAQQISHLSKVMTLLPGDLLATGTCAGVGVASGKFLQPGDVVRVEIDAIGHIENRVIAEP
jgi:2-keto-4-pentenoate hydratase/2-oxohepta-3-ene-1,7-dioic acid hydratase in catechol pathway